LRTVDPLVRAFRAKRETASRKVSAPEQDAARRSRFPFRRNRSIAFSGEVGTASREENAAKQSPMESKAELLPLIPSKAKML
jgi:hypothetical protein